VAEEPGAVDRRAARRRFERAAPGYRRTARFEAEIGARMLERLDYVRIEPRRILDAGSGPAREARALARRYRGATIVALDFSLAMLREARRGRGPFAALARGARPLAVCADLEHLPFVEGSFAMLWSNLALHWIAEPIGVLKEFHRVLEPGGLLMFSTLGPDTLKELREAAGADRVHRFLDMHDVGDRLVGAGFSDPVVDMDMMTLSYPGPDALIDEIRSTGQSNALLERRRGLSGRGFLARLRARLAQGMERGRLNISLEVVYGHAWKGVRRMRAGEPALKPVKFLRPGRK
jgi:malonyl-CoA O-methyltransferase